MVPRTTCWRALLTLTLVTLTSLTASAQTGRVGGLVRDEEGQPIKGAVVTAENANIANTFTATTDDRGRFIMIGLRPGVWRFTAHAPGYLAEAGDMPVRAAGGLNPPITFELRQSGPGPGGLLGSRAPKDLQSDLARADALFNEKRWDEAIAAYRTIMARTPALSVVNLQIAAAYRGKQDYSSALAAYAALLAADPGNEKALVGMTAINIERGDLAAAELALKGVADLPTAGAELLFTMGELKAAQGDRDQAVRWWTKAVESDVSWGKPLFRLGQLALDRGDTAGATTYLTKTIAVDPISPEAALARAALDTLNR